MSEQNRYRLDAHYTTNKGAESGWVRSYGSKPGDTWQDAIHEWLDRRWPTGTYAYTVISETPSEDGRSGIIETQFDRPDWRVKRKDWWVEVKFKATLIDD